MITELKYHIMFLAHADVKYSFSVQYVATVGAPPLILLLTNDISMKVVSR